LDVVGDKGRSRIKEHLVDQTYIDAEGNEQTKKGISFNPFMKTKLIGVLGSSFVKTNGVVPRGLRQLQTAAYNTCQFTLKRPRHT
jgi:hypothetical protein